MMTIARSSSMAGKKIVKGSEEWQMFQDFWELAQEIWEPEDTDEYWELVGEKTKEFYEKYRTPYACGFAVGLVNTLDEVWKEGRK